jgi:membrane protein implicated in regulation of membrane protease activity
MWDWTIAWWVWIIGAFGLGLLEMTTPGGFYFLFFGIGAALTGFLAWGPLEGQTTLQLLLFSVISVASSLAFRRPLMRRFAPRIDDIPVDSMIGETATALEDIAASGFGKVELRGSSWNARNSGDRTLSRGERCTVERVDGLSLWVRL